MEIKNNKKSEQVFSPFVLGLIFVSLFFLLLYNTYGIFYLSNDDTGIMKTYSGYTTGVPNAYHAYGSYALGLFFQVLYTMAPKMNWYTYGSILVVLVSNAIIIGVVYENRANVANGFTKYIDFILIAFLVIAISLYGINRISWTINATFSAIAGTMLLLKFEEGEIGRWRYYVGALFLFIISLIIRSSSYKAVLPFAVFVLIYHASMKFDRPIIGAKNVKSVLFYGIMMLPLIGILECGKLDSFIKQEIFPNVSGSFEYYRGLFTDSYHIPFDGNEEFYESIGWDAEFYNMTKSWFFIDPRFNTENLRMIAEKSAEARDEDVKESEKRLYWDEYRSMTDKNAVRVTMTWGVLALLVYGIVMSVYCLIKKKEWRVWVLLVLAEMLAITEWVWLVVGRGRFIDRAFYCATFPALFIGMWVVFKHVSVMNRYKVLYIVAAVLTAWVFHLAFHKNISAASSESTRKSARISVDADEIAFRHPENLYISDMSIAQGVFLFLDMDLAGCGKNRMLWGGYRGI